MGAMMSIGNKIVDALSVDRWCSFCMYYVGQTNHCNQCGDLVGSCCSQIIDGTLYCIGCK